MKAFFEQLGSSLGAAIAAACCLGIPAVLSAMGALGLSFLIHDAYLFPIFVGFVGLSLWVLYRSAHSKGRMGPFWLAAAGGATGAAALWLLLTGVWPQPIAVYGGVATLLAGSVWDWVNLRRGASACAAVCEVSARRAAPPLARGAALSVAAAAAFYGMYKSVDVMAPQAEASETACWGINACRGQTACTTAFNACNGQNECRGRGFLFVPAEECEARGGRPLAGSEGDPARS